MKNILKTLVIMFATVSCNAQTLIKDIEDYDGEGVVGAYYKDTLNQLNLFEGTYLYTNGNETFKLVLQKKLMSNQNNFYFEDLIVGAFQHIINGVEVRNTLNNLNINYPNQRSQSIDGNMLLKGTELGCSDCSPTEKRLRLGFVEGVSNLGGFAQVRRITINGQPGINFSFYWEMNYNGSAQTPSSLTLRSYNMIKI
jgi:hypothetical protein